jgi:hypothetical protein
MKTAIPNQIFSGEPVPDMPENTGAILALVTLKLADAPVPGLNIPSRRSKLSFTHPCATALPSAHDLHLQPLKVPGMREFDLETAIGQPR